VDASKAGVVFMRFANDARPTVELSDGADFPLKVTVTDTLTFGTEIEVPVDLVILSVGVMPRDVTGLIEMTHAPVGADGFLLEVHPKLRPVESAIPGCSLRARSRLRWTSPRAHRPPPQPQPK